MSARSTICYARASFDGINCFTCPKTNAILGHHCRLSVEVLNGVVIFSHHGALGKLAAVEGKLTSKEAELASAHDKLAGKKANWNRPNGSLRNPKTRLTNVQGAQAIGTASTLRQGLDVARTELGRKEVYILELPTPLPAPIEPLAVSRRRLHRRGGPVLLQLGTPRGQRFLEIAMV